MKWIKRKLKDLVHTIYSIYLCIRFPFLYPRNSFTGLHYTNWKLHERQCELYKKAYGDLHIHKSITNQIINGEKEPRKYVPLLDRHLAKIEYHIISWIHEVFLQIVFCIPTYTYLDFMPKGWRIAFGIRMCEDIKKALLQEGGRKLLRKYRIVDIKEKYGSLRWYDLASTRKVNRIIEKYEYISFRTCIVCGDIAAGFTTGWISPYCSKCKSKDELTLFGTKDNPWYGWSFYH